MMTIPPKGLTTAAEEHQKGWNAWERGREIVMERGMGECKKEDDGFAFFCVVRVGGGERSAHTHGGAGFVAGRAVFYLRGFFFRLD